MGKSMINLMRSLLLLIFGVLYLQIAKAQEPFFHQLADSALTLTHQNVTYDPTYFDIPYSEWRCTSK
jgi:uncharacterized protein YijF (DUF1287 family)